MTDSFDVTAVSVDDAKTHIASAKADELDAIEKAEKAGAARVGVLDAVDARRKELDKELADEKAGTPGTPASTKPASTLVKLGRGAYPDTPLDAIPGFYLGMVLGGAASDCPWDQLSKEQQEAVIAENARRHPPGVPTEPAPVKPASGLESAQEMHAREVQRSEAVAAVAASVARTPVTPVPSDADAAPDAATDAKIESAVDAAVPTTGKGSRKAKAAAEGTAAEASDIIAAADLEELAVIEKAENAGKNRVSVHAAIDKRRAELTPTPPPTPPTP